MEEVIEKIEKILKNEIKQEWRKIKSKKGVFFICSNNYKVIIWHIENKSIEYTERINVKNGEILEQYKISNSFLTLEEIFEEIYNIVYRHENLYKIDFEDCVVYEN